jgi:hypothetical protein
MNMYEGECEEENYDDNEADLIPGDNSLPLPPSTLTNPAPDNLSRIPAQGGQIPIEVEPPKPQGD